MAIQRYRGTLTFLAGAVTGNLIAAQALAAGTQLAIKEIRLSKNNTGAGNRTALYEIQQGGVTIAAFQGAVAGAERITRLFRTPLVVDGLAVATSVGIVITISGASNNDVAYGTIIGELTGRPNNTVRTYGANAGAGGTIATYTVPAGRTLYITDLTYAAVAADVLTFSIAGVTVYDGELFAIGEINETLVTPLIATAGQVVLMTHANAVQNYGVWVGYLV